MIVTLSQRSAGPEKLGAGSNKVGANFLSRMRKHRMRPNRRSNQKNLLHPVQYWTNRFWFGVINHHAFQSGGSFGCYVRWLECRTYLQPYGERSAKCSSVKRTSRCAEKRR